jgi:cutinase
MVMLFGSTHNVAEGGRIPRHDSKRTKVFCAIGDEVCGGTWTILSPHLTFGQNTTAAATFLVDEAAMRKGWEVRRASLGLFLMLALSYA